jgi:hypothetical protein
VAFRLSPAYPVNCLTAGDAFAGGQPLRPGEQAVVSTLEVLDPAAGRTGPRPVAFSERTATLIGKLIGMVPRDDHDQVVAERNEALERVEHLEALLSAYDALRDAAARLAASEPAPAPKTRARKTKPTVEAEQ